MPDEFEGDLLDDVIVDITDAIGPEAESRHLLKRRLRGTLTSTTPPVPLEKRFPAPRRLDIGAGLIREPGWIAVDIDPRTSPDILADAQSLLITDNSVQEARMLSALSWFSLPARALREVWRVLVSNGLLTIVEPYPFSTESVLPGLRHALSPLFWSHVTRNNVTEYVPANAHGRWELLSYKREVHQNMLDQVCRKLKFTPEQAMNLMPGLVRRQTVRLQKVVL